MFFFHREKDDFERQGGRTTFNTVKRTRDATGVSKSTVMNIRNDAEVGELKSLVTVNITQRITLDGLQAGAFRRMFHDMHLEMTHS